MISLLLVTAENGSLSELVSALKKYDDVEIYKAESEDKVLHLLLAKTFDLLIIDEVIEDTLGLDFAEKLVSINPMLNCAVVSTISSESFHEPSEGRGFFMQLPVRPEKEHADLLFQHLKKVLHITKG